MKFPAALITTIVLSGSLAAAANTNRTIKVPGIHLAYFAPCTPPNAMVETLTPVVNPINRVSLLDAFYNDTPYKLGQDNISTLSHAWVFTTGELAQTITIHHDPLSGNMMLGSYAGKLKLVPVVPEKTEFLKDLPRTGTNFLLNGSQVEGPSLKKMYEEAMFFLTEASNHK